MTFISIPAPLFSRFEPCSTGDVLRELLDYDHSTGSLAILRMLNDVYSAADNGSIGLCYCSSIYPRCSTLWTRALNCGDFDLLTVYLDQHSTR